MGDNITQTDYVFETLNGLALFLLGVRPDNFQDKLAEMVAAVRNHSEDFSSFQLWQVRDLALRCSVECDYLVGDNWKALIRQTNEGWNTFPMLAVLAQYKLDHQTEEAKPTTSLMNLKLRLAA